MQSLHRTVNGLAQIHFTVAKNSKTPSPNGAAQAVNATPNPDAAAPLVAPKKRAQSAPKLADKATRKKPAAASKKTTGRRRSTKAKEAFEPSESEIRLRAYFIAERRAELGHHGDPSNDWLEARQQLVDEAAQSGPA